MKIRIKGNSLRYRLTRSDVETLGTEAMVEECTEFAGNTLIYAIAAISGDRLSAEFTGNRIQLNMPVTMIKELVHTDTVGFEDHNGPVHLLVEKDFACIERTEEDQSDQYPNPSAVC